MEGLKVTGVPNGTCGVRDNKYSVEQLKNKISEVAGVEIAAVCEGYIIKNLVWQVEAFRFSSVGDELLNWKLN